MLLSDLKLAIEMRTGQFIGAGTTAYEITAARFKLLVARELAKYSHSRPHQATYLSVNISESGLYTFALPAPDWVAGIKLASFLDTDDVSLSLANQLRRSGGANPPVEFKYLKPDLYMTYAGLEVDIETAFYWLIEENDDGVDAITDLVEAEEPYLVDLVEAATLIGLGRSRRAFVANDIPLAYDASELISEGQDLHQQTMEHLKEQSKWWLAAG